MRSYPALTVRWAEPGDTERTDRLLAALDDAGITAVEEIPSGLRLYFTSSADRDAAQPIASALTGIPAQASDVPDDDWAARSQAALGPITVGAITIAPPWSVTPELRAKPGHVIVVQPSMGFGTGHHASTRLCLGWLQRIPLRGARVVDVGTGSGVLAIAAAILGASHAAGLDVDPDAVTNARENVELNGLAAQVAIHEMDLASAAERLGQRFDLAVANLTGGLLSRAAPAFTTLTTPGAQLVVSGFQTHETEEVIDALRAAGWDALGEAVEDDWVACLLSRRAVTSPTSSTTR